MPPIDESMAIEITPTQTIRFGRLAELVRYGVVNPPIFTGIGTHPVEFKLIWRGISNSGGVDYSLFYHIYREDDPETVMGNADGMVNKPPGWELNHYSTSFWASGEYIIDRRGFYIPRLPNGDNYRVRVGFYRLDTWERLPVYVDGEWVGDSYTLDISFSVSQSD